MSNFTPKVPFATDYDGDKVTMNLKRFKKETIVKMSPYLMDNPTETDGTVRMAFENEIELTKMMDDILPEQIEDFKGLVMPDGTVISLKEAMDEAYFMPLFKRILGKLFDISKPSVGKKDDPKDDGEAGNSTGQEQGAATE